MNLPVIVLGAGGHAKVVVDALIACSANVIGITDADPSKAGRTVLGVRVIGGDDAVRTYSPSDVALINGVGSIGQTGARRTLFDKFKHLGYSFATVVHPSATIASSARLGEGAQVMAGGVIQPDCTIGVNTIINTNASIDHDCVIGAHVHVAPGVTLSGGVRVGDNVHIGSGSTVLQGVTLGADCIVGAGSVVLAAIPPGHKVAGVPAVRLKT